MNDQSPPKRVTRSRAAAKTTDTGMKTTRVATAAAKAKLTRSTSTTKRKTRAHEAEQEEESHPETVEEAPKPETRATRGRPKKVVVVQPAPEPEPQQEPTEEAAPPARATRGRAKSVTTDAAPAPSTRSTRGRAKKTEDVEETQESIAVQAPPARSTRARAATLTKAATVKKNVKFQEPDKENVLPPTSDAKGKEKATAPATGLRAKPLRRPAAAATATTTTTTRATRGKAQQVEEPKEKSPLSPKKATQISVPREASLDDELATTEEASMKPLSKSPVKPAGSLFGPSKQLDFSAITVQRAATSPTEDQGMASPARRPPQSPFKDAIKTSPQRLPMGDSFLRSPLKLTLLPPQSSEPSQPLKASLLQSPARRPPSPMKVTEAGSPTRVKPDPSLLNATPKPAVFAISRFATPKTLPKISARSALLASSTALRTGLPSFVESEAENELVDLASQEVPPLKFSGRLSSIAPRDPEAVLTPSDPIVEDVEEPAAENPVEEDDGDIDMEDSIEVDTGARATTPPPSSPLQHNMEHVARTQVDEDQANESESEDELSSLNPEHASVPLSALKLLNIDLFPSPEPIPFASMEDAIKAAISTPNPRPSRVNSPANRSSAQRESNVFSANSLSEWVPSSPTQQPSTETAPTQGSPSPTMGEPDLAEENMEHQSTPVKNSFFEEEMSIRQDDVEEDIESPALVSEELTVHVPALEPGSSPLEVDDEDLALAAEADEMSLLEPEEIVEATEPEATEATDIPEVPEVPEVDDVTEVADVMEGAKIPEVAEVAEATDVAEVAEVAEVTDVTEVAEVEPTPSEDSQEYGDENAMPLDPALFGPPTSNAPQTPVRSTPKRVLTERISHTVSKVPLKPAADDTPRRPMTVGRSMTVARLPGQRPTGMLKRNHTVISYSPKKRASVVEAQSSSEDVIMRDSETPSKSDTQAWSTIATPARTPRRDLNGSLLKGAVVFVDVHTTEGADASGLFTELLTQMGARCVKSWTWNGNAEDGSKIGITHIVFKDGGKRTLEKARESGGVVACVGVGWVLE